MRIESTTTLEGYPTQMKKYISFFIIAGLVIIIDQVTKISIIDRIDLHQTVQIIPGFLNLTHVHNPGGAFGFLASNSSFLRPLVFYGAAVFALVLIFYFFYKTPESFRFLTAALSMVFGGAVGNLIDRFRMGFVIDFLDVYVGKYHWPAFNVADSAITVGVVIFILHIVTNKLPD